jgi:peptidoglycan/xylan/chitin deacetylase (PgdA/CDA1 family)
MTDDPASFRHRRFSNKVVTRFKSDDAVALTFDDGPDPQFTPQLLEILTKHGARATFFVLGRQAELYPYILRQILEAGSEIANHSYGHPSFSLLSTAQKIAELGHCEQAIGKAAKKYFRPPFGHASGGTPRWASLLGYVPVCWSADATDWDIDDPGTIGGLLDRNVRPGTILLLHDRLETAIDARHFDRGAMLSALDAFLARSKDSWRFNSLTEMFSAYEAVFEDWDKSPDKQQLLQRKQEFLALKRNSP